MTNDARLAGAEVPEVSACFTPPSRLHQSRDCTMRVAIYILAPLLISLFSIGSGLVMLSP
jgi:hypothetical protein